MMHKARAPHFNIFRIRGVILWLWFGLPCLLAACGDESAKAANQGARGERSARGQSAAAPAIAVSNSWLECCLLDLEGGCSQIGDVDSISASDSNGGGGDLKAAGLPLARICPPGTCPGHFDIRPAAAAELRECRYAFLFDFQQSMTEKLKALSSDRIQVFAIPAPEGLCVPASYLAGCESVRAALDQAYPEKRELHAAAIQRIRLRIEALEKDVRRQVQSAGLKDAKVAASGHQSRFCQWLGLDPAAVYSGSEVSSPAQIEEMLDKGKSSGVRVVIANQQESAQAGEAIAQRLGVPVVVFSNFPSMKDRENTFDELVRMNVERLLGAMKFEAAKSEAEKSKAIKSEAVKSTAVKSDK